MGPNHAAMAGWIRENDPTRPIHYEGAAAKPRDPAWVDVVSRMYTRIPELAKMAKDPAETRPIVLCEYAYARGNAVGNLKEYWDLDRVAGPADRRLHLGLGGQGPAQARRRRARVLGLRRRLRRRAERRHDGLQRHRAPRPDARSRSSTRSRRSTSGSTRRRVDAAAGRAAGEERLRLPLLDFVEVLVERRARRPGRRRGPDAGARPRAEAGGRAAAPPEARRAGAGGRGVPERPLRPREGRALGEGGARGGLGAAPAAAGPEAPAAVALAAMPPRRARRVGARPHRDGRGLQRRGGPRDRRPRVVPPRGARARRLAARPELLARAARQRHRLPAAQRHAPTRSRRGRRPARSGGSLP